MSLIDAIILGIIQGLTEFLPVSSSGHLVILQDVLGMDPSDIFFNVLLHGATLCSTVVIFRKKIKAILISLLNIIQKKSTDADQKHLRLTYYIMTVTFITGTLGIAFKDFFTSLFHIKMVSVTLFFTGVILFLPKWLPWPPTQPMSGFGFKRSIWMGLAQALAIIPGISRSGTTISAGLLLGLPRKDAGEFAFLISLPVILGAFILELKDVTILGDASFSIYAFGFLASFLTGLFALTFLLRWIEQGKLHYFAFYCWFASIVVALKSYAVF